MKGQSEVVTFVMLGTVVVTLVGAAYMWGAPLTEKRSSLAESEGIAAFFVTLNSKIKEIAQTCTGSCTESIALSQKGLYSVFNYAQYYLDQSSANEYNNSIVLTTVAAKNVYALDRWIGLNTGNIGAYANFGEQEGVLMVKMAKNTAGDYTAVYRLWYREIDTPNKGFRIDIEAGPVQNVTSGKVSITYDGRFIIANGAANGKDLEISRVKINFA
ncbi:MAG: hypothetical protein HY515_04655 [Candidatus Aenigmarchaeota archaeon]|nr:hypothetical protein [Candidatus Aenigmarchaeota archaeon]